MTQPRALLRGLHLKSTPAQGHIIYGQALFHQERAAGHMALTGTISLARSLSGTGLGWPVA